MKPTRLPVLAAMAAVAGVLAYLLVRASYRDLPPVPRYAPASLLLLAIAEAVTASSVRARLAGRPRTRPIHPIVVARAAALAKASSLVAALAVGGYGGLFGYALSQRDQIAAASSDAVVSAIGAGSALLLVLAALALERSCRRRDEPPPSDESRPANG